MDEVELKFLDIDVKEIKQKLESLGAELKYDTIIESYPFLRKGFSRSDSSLKGLRVRKINNDVIITYKGPKIDSKMTVREEIEIRVDSYERALLLIERLGFERGEVFRKHRFHYEFGEVHFEIDTLDNVLSYLEIETKSEDKMKEICLKLDLDISKGKKGTIVEILPEKFDV